MAEHIHPIFDQMLQRRDKEALIHQKGLGIWMTGLSGSGKSTIAKGLEQRLYREGYLTKLLDGDNVRSGLCNNLGFSAGDRAENIRRVSEVSRLFVDAGLIVINSFISPTRTIRDQARQIIGPDAFFEVYVNCPLSTCEERDVKGLYEKARAGEIPDFTGIHTPFEEPRKPDCELDTTQHEPAESVDLLYQAVLPHIRYQG
jgi:adenylylsulfate kinase